MFVLIRGSSTTQNHIVLTAKSSSFDKPGVGRIRSDRFFRSNKVQIVYLVEPIRDQIGSDFFFRSDLIRFPFYYLIYLRTKKKLIFGENCFEFCEISDF
jgi:hypothetical protein